MPPPEAAKVIEAVSGVAIAAGAAISGVIALAAELRRSGLIDDAAAERIRDALLSGLLAGPREARAMLSASIQKQWDETVPSPPAQKPEGPA